MKSWYFDVDNKVISKLINTNNNSKIFDWIF